MLFAIVDGKKMGACPNALGACQLCNGKVFSKCGELNVWNWAHYKDKNCDYWFEPETEWHKNWKLIFGEHNSEIVISKNSVRHIADILTKDKVVIELQNSPIQPNVIRERETLYGEQMIWVVNGIRFKESFSIFKSPLEEDEEYRLHNSLYKYYGKPLNDSNQNEFNFSWRWSKISWEEAQRDIYIDFGDENLFFVYDGMGTNSGRGRKISKERFIVKYGGDLNLLATMSTRLNN
jgi:hypothetical protein